MAKRFKGLEKLNDLLANLFRNDIFDQTFLQKQADFVVERIRAFTRGGRSIAGQKPVKLKPLSQSYIQVREGAVKFRTINGKKVPFPEPDERLNKVDPEFFEPRLSNLTFTGQMLRSLNARVQGTKMIVETTGSRDDGKTNSEVAGYVAQQGRPFIGLDQTGIARIRREAVREIRKILRSKKRR